jgi:hypothetical protein
MKKILIGLAAIVLLISCQKQTQEEAANIPGMGNTPGELQIEKPFTLPAGVSLVGDITGIDDPGTKSAESKSISLYGSGGRMVKLVITLLNTSNYSKTIFFPKGLIFKCQTAGYQHAILLQTVWITVRPNTKRTIYLDLYCINYGLAPSSSAAYYQILGLTNSEVIKILLNYLGWRIINYEMIFGYFGQGKGEATTPTYDEITERLQTIVWNLTNNGIDISADDKAFIESIPELPAEQRPQLDENANYPEYFEEFSMSID